MTKKERENIKEHTYYVKGMHCPSCELLIEKKLLKAKGIESVEASTSKGQAVIYYQGKKPSLKELNKQFQESGYVFLEEPSLDEEEPPLFSFDKERHLLINKPKFYQSAQVLGVAILFIIGFIFLSRSGVATRVVVNSFSPLPAFFLFGLIAGISSCAALVGGIVLSMSKQWAEIYGDESPDWQRFQPHLLFNFGRLISFTLLGLLLGTLGAFLQIALTVTSLLAILISVVMVLLALQMLGVQRFQKLQPTMPKFMTRFVADETNFKGRYMPFLLGALTFFLPCGFTLTAQGLALASGSGLQGLLIMLFFALGTLPTLTVIGFSSLKLTARPHLSEKFIKIAGVLVLFFGIYNFNSQLNVLGLPSLDDVELDFLAANQVPKDGLAPIIKGKQVIKMDALAYGYEPNEFKIRAGIPVRWEIRNKGVSGCTNAIVSRGLFDGQIDLNQELAVKEFTPQKPGKYKFSCWMGMISGIIQVIGEDESTPETVNVQEKEIPSGVKGCGGVSGGGCTGSCGGGCGNPNCPYAR
ncbi:sulfite exporter TauE/SafE family protein [Patescibacteria group bacterium]|nr:sulfite exporter TauE/SafE family protein [Patescibacteria group bacterium]